MSILFFILATVCYTISQKAQHSGDTSKNKYKQPLQIASGWYSKLFSLKYKERFALSGSLLVALTDKYHAFQSFFKIFLCLSIVLYAPMFQWWLDAIIFWVIFGVVFSLIYRFAK